MSLPGDVRRTLQIEQLVVPILCLATAACADSNSTGGGDPTGPDEQSIATTAEEVDVSEAIVGIGEIELEGEDENLKSEDPFPLTFSAFDQPSVRELHRFSGPPGSYDRLKVELARLDSDASSPVAGHSIHISGSVVTASSGRRDFVFTSDLHRNLTADLAPPLEVDEASAGRLEQIGGLSLDPAGLFRDDEGELLNPRHPDNEERIEESIVRSLRARAGQLFSGFAFTATAEDSVPSILAHESGLLGGPVAGTSGEITGYEFTLPHAGPLSLRLDDHGLPRLLTIDETYVGLYENWRSDTVDFALLGPDGDAEVFRDLTVAGDIPALAAETSGASPAVSEASGDLDSGAINPIEDAVRGIKLGTFAACATIIDTEVSNFLTEPLVGDLADDCESGALQAAEEIDERTFEGLGLARRGTKFLLDCYGDPIGEACIRTGVETIEGMADASDVFVDERSREIEAARQALLVSSVAYVTNQDSDALSVIDGGSQTVTSTIPVGDGPQGVAFTPDGSTAYVTNGASGDVSVLDVPGGTVTGAIDVGEDPISVTFTPDGSTAYVAHFSVDDGISVIDVATGSVSGTIPVGDGPRSVAFTPDGSTAYATSDFGDYVSVIDVASESVTGTITVGELPSSVAFTPDGTTAYVPVFRKDLVAVIDVASEAVTGTISVGDRPVDVAFTPAGSTAYVVNRVATAVDSPEENGTVSVIDVASGSVTGTIQVGDLARSVAFGPDGAVAYVVNHASDDVSVIDVEAGEVVSTIPVGDAPWRVAVSP